MLVDFKRPISHIKYLSSFTSDEWIKLALSNPIEILIDHAHCERKAAGVAIQLIIGGLVDLEILKVAEDFKKYF